jgi:hypothetical protein
MELEATAMGYRVLAFLVSFAWVAFLPASSLAAETGGDPSKAAKKDRAEGESKAEDAVEKPAGESYSVVQVGDSVKVVKSTAVGALRDKANEDFKASLRAYEEAKKAAAKAKKKFTDPKPAKPVFKTVATALRTEDVANALRTKTVQKIESQKKKDREERAKARQGG